jgi:outer membrane protein TolC
LQEEITNLNKKIANTASYPQLNFGAQASYQSEVTELQTPPGSPFTGPDLSKDQYKATLDVSQSIFNGGATGIKKNLEEIRGQQQQYSTEVQLHQLKKQVDQVYFSILLARQQLDIIETLLENLRVQIKEVKSKVRNGVLLPSQQYILEAELVKTHQDSIEIKSNIHSGYEVLSQLIGEELHVQTVLKLPENQPVYQDQDSLAQLRPEFDLFKSNRQTLDYQKDLANTNKIPSVSAFGTAAYGRPGFNFFENDLHPYYIVGLRIQWNFWGSHNATTQQQVYNLQQRSITEDQRVFERRVRSTLSKKREQIESLQSQIQQDEKIIKRRERVVATIASQIKSGTATATEYITELNKATQARLSMMMHKIKLEQAKTDYQTTLGISNN